MMTSVDPLDALRATELSLSEVARRSGVSRNTLNLWLRGESRPGLEALEKVLPVLGYAVSLRAERLSDAEAATAARYLCGELAEVSAAARVWIGRFERWGDLEEFAAEEPASAAALTDRAAWASNPYGRAGARHFLPTTPLTVASAAQAGGGEWAVSGAYAVELGAEPAVARADAPSMTLVWCEDPAACAASLPGRVRETPRPVAGGLSLVPIGGCECAGATTRGGVRCVAPVQLAIDIAAEREENQHA